MPRLVPHEMMNVPASVRVARGAEVLYALIALVLALGLPWPPSARSAVGWVHWVGTAILAAVIAVRLARPNRTRLVVAALLAAYVVLSALLGIGRLVSLWRSSAGGTFALGAALAAAVVATQLAVAVCVYLAWPRAGGAR